MLKQIALGIIIAIGGACLIYFSEPISSIVGEIQRAEKNLGGTRKGIIAFGFLVMVIGFLILFGVINISSPTEIKGF